MTLTDVKWANSTIVTGDPDFTLVGARTRNSGVVVLSYRTQG